MQFFGACRAPGQAYEAPPKQSTPPNAGNDALGTARGGAIDFRAYEALGEICKAVCERLRLQERLAEWGDLFNAVDRLVTGRQARARRNLAAYHRGRSGRCCARDCPSSGSEACCGSLASAESKSTLAAEHMLWRSSGILDSVYGGGAHASDACKRLGADNADVCTGFRVHVDTMQVRVRVLCA